MPGRFPLIESANKVAYPTVTGSNAVHAVQRRGIRVVKWRGKGSEGKSSVTQRITTLVLSVSLRRATRKGFDYL